MPSILKQIPFIIFKYIDYIFKTYSYFVSKFFIIIKLIIAKK
jgi:hypothetical protein